MIGSALICGMVFVSCGSYKAEQKDSHCASCENKQILKVLKDEPVFVRKGCFEHLGRIDAFYFELVNPHTEFFYLAGIFPCDEIPKQFMEEGLSVKISGNVTSCLVLGGCSEPNLKIAAIPVFELESIKINNQ